jgi:transcriptional regulator with XRE-family HTH domain
MNRSEFIANKIKELREAVSWSQSELSRKSGVTSAAISKIEQGGRIPSMTVTRKIADAFKVPVSELTGDEINQTTQINEEAQAFYRKFADLNDLNEHDQKLILGIIKSMKD